MYAQASPEREYPLRLPARSARKTGAPPNESVGSTPVALRLCVPRAYRYTASEVAMSKATVSPRPAGEGWEWIVEFGGGAWVQYPLPPQKPVLESAGTALRRALYGPGYQGPQGTRSTTGTWTHYPGL